MERLRDFFTLKAGEHRGRKIAVLNLLPEEFELSAKDLKDNYFGAMFVYEGILYKVVGVENVRFFVPGTPPAIGVVLEEIKDKINIENETRDN